MSTQWKGKKALVTGASSGIGRAIARAFGQAGVELVIAARRADALEKLAGEIARAGGPRPTVIVADLSKRGEAAWLAERALEALGEIDLLINNAGVGVGGAQVVVGDDDEARTLFETNYWTALALTRALVPGMRARGAGAVVNVSSIGSITPMPLAGHYSSSKAALSLATETLRLELRGSGIHVLHVLPGPVETGMLAEIKEIPGGEKLLQPMPKGKPEVLAKKVMKALERKRRAIVYPGSLSIVRHLPTVAMRLGESVLARVDTSDERKLMGGSQGDELARKARSAFEEKAARRELEARASA